MIARVYKDRVLKSYVHEWRTNKEEILRRACLGVVILKSWGKHTCEIVAGTDESVFLMTVVFGINSFVPS